MSIIFLTLKGTGDSENRLSFYIYLKICKIHGASEWTGLRSELSPPRELGLLAYISFPVQIPAFLSSDVKCNIDEIGNYLKKRPICIRKLDL